MHAKERGRRLVTPVADMQCMVNAITLQYIAKESAPQSQTHLCCCLVLLGVVSKNLDTVWSCNNFWLQLDFLKLLVNDFCMVT